MELTQHARKRKSQRNMPDSAIDIIVEHGRLGYVHGGAMEIFLGEKESREIIKGLKDAIKVVERARGGSLIVTEDKVLTVYKKH
jgi:hypothetical protein